MKTRRQSSIPRAGVTFTQAIGDKRRIIAANEPKRGSGHWVVLAAVAAVVVFIALSLFAGR